MEKWGTLCYGYSSFENNLAVFKQLNINLLFNPEIPLLPIYPRGMKTCPHRIYYINGLLVS